MLTDLNCPFQNKTDAIKNTCRPLIIRKMVASMSQIIYTALIQYNQL